MTTDVLRFGQIPHMEAQGVAFFGEFYAHEVQFQNSTGAWTDMKTSSVPGFFTRLIKSLKLIEQAVLSSIFRDMEGKEGIWVLLF